MKSLTVFDEIHREVKARAAVKGQTVPTVASGLLRMALEIEKAGNATIPEGEIPAEIERLDTDLKKSKRKPAAPALVDRVRA